MTNVGLPTALAFTTATGVILGVSPSRSYSLRWSLGQSRASRNRHHRHHDHGCYSPSFLTPLGDVGRLVDITGFSLLLAVLGKLYAATAAALGSATIVGWRQLYTLGYEARTRKFTRKDWE